MKAKSAAGISIIGGADGPTSFFIASKRPTARQRIRRIWHGYRRSWIAGHLPEEAHTIDEVCEYIQKKYGFIEEDKNTRKYQQRCRDIRYELIVKHSPGLLGEYAGKPVLKGRREEDVRAFWEKLDKRKRAACQVSDNAFQTDIHIYKKQIKGGEFHLIVEKRFGFISGGAQGRKAIKKFRKVYRDVYRFYGVTKEDIRKKSQRYNALLETLI